MGNIDSNELNNRLKEIRAIAEQIRECVGGWDARSQKLEAAMVLLEMDGHVFGTRPCDTCTKVSTLIGRKWGCVGVAEKRLERMKRNQLL